MSHRRPGPLPLPPSRATARQAPRRPLALLLLLGACSQLVEAETTQCQSDRDCLALGNGSQEATCEEGTCQLVTREVLQWGCLAVPAWESFPGWVTYVVTFLDSVTGEPPAHLQVRSCAASDLACASPLDGPFEANALGRYAIALPRGFTGYLEIQGEGLIPTLLHFPQPLLDQHALAPQSWILVREDEWDAYARLAGVRSLPADAGLVTGRIHDCEGNVIEGVTAAPSGDDEDVSSYYFVQSLPTVGPDATDPSGEFGAAGLPQGNASFSFTIGDRAYPDRTVIVRAGALTLAPIHPH